MENTPTPISFQGVEVDTVRDNKLDWATNTEAVKKPWLQSFIVCITMLRIFYQSVVSKGEDNSTTHLPHVDREMDCRDMRC